MYTILVEYEESFLVITFGICMSFEDLGFNPDSYAKFQFCWNASLDIQNYRVLTLLFHISLHNEVKALHRDFDFIYTDGSVLNEKVAAAAIIDNSSIDSLPDKSSLLTILLLLIALGSR